MKENKDIEEYFDYLIFKIEDQYFAVLASSVIEIVDKQPVTLLPFVPEYVDGLINVKGMVMPQLYFSKIINKADKVEISTDEIIIIESLNSPCAIKIDSLVGKYNIRKEGVVSYKESNLNELSSEKNLNGFHEEEKLNKCICGEFYLDNQIVLVIDSYKLAGLISIKGIDAQNDGVWGNVEENIDHNKDVRVDCLVLKNDKERYGFNLKNILEVVDNIKITPLPGTPAEVLGMTMIRGDSLLVLSLSSLLGLKAESGNADKLIIIEKKGMAYGISVSEIEGIFHFEESEIQVIDDESAELSGVITNGKQNIIGLIEPDKIIKGEFEKIISKFIPEKKSEELANSGEIKKVLKIKIADEIFAVPVESIVRVSEYKTPQSIKNDNDSKLAGVVDHNGSVIPVISLDKNKQKTDMHKNINQEEPVKRPNAGFLIMRHNGNEWAMEITEAKEIVDLPVSNIEEVYDNNNELIEGVANIDEEIISLLNVSEIMSI